MASSAFVSFHDEDIHFITDFVLDPLRSSGIHVFVKGESTTFDLFQAIERSRFLIVVFSKNYPSSICCLRELMAIINAVESSPWSNNFLSIYHGVQQSEVLLQMGCYGQVFSKYEERFREHKERMEEMQRWREALTRVAGFPGLNMENVTGYGGFDFVQYAARIFGREFLTSQNETISSRYGNFDDIVQYKDGDEVSYKELRGLIRLRDFISLVLTYPVKLEEDGVLRSWISSFPEWKAQLLSTDGFSVICKPWNLLTEKALGCMKGFMPVEIMAEIESGERSLFNRHNDVIPEGLLPLIVDLAVNQLIQTLFSGDYCARYIRLLTRNSSEKESVVNKVLTALEDKHVMFGIDKDFLMAVWINALTCETDAEVQVQEEINMIMGSISTTEGDDLLTTLDTDKKKRSNRLLVIVVDADSNKRLDLQKVQFPTGIVVLITTESSTQAVKDDDFGIACTMDLNIWTQDHMLPWKLFYTYVGSCINCSSMTIQKIAVEIVKKSHGHLLAIVLVAKHLRYVKDDKYWEFVLDKLSNPNPFYDYQNCDGIGISRVMVNAFVNIIWEGIDDELKLCLQLSLPVHNIKNGVRDDILVSYWANILRYTQELGEYKRQLQYYLEELLDCFVLLKFESREVYLPIETYDIIKSLHISKPSIIWHGALGLTEIGQWHSLIQIELVNNNICELPQSPDCPKLKVLLLQGNADLLDIPDSFFDHMLLLQHLDLSYTSIRDLPPSLTKSMQLKKLYLKGCDLIMEISPQIFQLKNLEELDLDGTLITHLPKDIRELINLQRLALCFDAYHHVLSHGNKGRQISNTMIIPSGVISNLTQLNYLSLDVDPEDEQWSENVNSVLVEILGLEKLKTVSIYVPKADLLELIPAEKSLNFRLVVGHHMRRLISRVTPELETKFKDFDYSMKFVNGVNVPNGVKMILSRVKALYLDRHMTIKSLSDFNLRNIRGLKVCILAECNEMETIFDGDNSADEDFSLMLLELLSVFYMKSLRSIGQECNTLYCLKYIALHSCPMLTTIFSDTFISLPFLEEISIEDCPKLTTLISSDARPKQNPEFFLLNLRVMSLLYLPNLVNIFNGLRVEHALEEMNFYCCPKLQSLSRSELPSKYLKFIKGERMWWEALEWSVSEWGNDGRPKFFEQFFKPINVEADTMNPAAAQLNKYHRGMYQGVSSSTELMTKLHLETPILSPSTPFPLSGSKEGEAQKRKAVTEPIIVPPLLRSSNQGSRKRRLLPQSVKEIRTDETLDDGFSWRKIAQKNVKGAKYPREYYRCIYGTTHGCQARKRVQRLDGDPTTFEVTYGGIHSCTQNDDLIAESGDAEALEDFGGKPDSASSSNKNAIIAYRRV
ncbi:hypothetical protein V8G54_004620 [Vigna mungo]|uniref:WRKY domain-containing protein n=1 Tax=Vigna mungo TaxID=3915 RepID=A0AAQ3PDR9_VIGMU